MPSRARTQADLEVRHGRDRSGLRVSFVTTTYPRFEGDHTPRFVADLAARLHADHGLEVTVLAPHGHGLAREESMHGVNVRRFQYAFRSERQSLADGYGMPDNLRRVPATRRQLPGFVAAMGVNVLRLLPKCHVLHGPLD